MPTISSDAQKVLAGASPEAVTYATQNAPGKKLTSGEAQRLINQFQSSGAYSGTNVINAITNPSPTYDYSDPYGARTSIEQRLGLGEATTAEQEAQKALLGFQDTTRAQINALRANRDLSTGLEAGYESQRTREADQREQVLANELALAQQRRLALEGKVGQEYEIFREERQNRENLLLQAIQAGAKNVNIGMTTAQLTQAYTKASEEKAKQEAKDKYKSDLKSSLLQLGIKTSGSTKELEKRLRKAIKAQGASESEIKALDLALKRKELAKPYYKDTGESDYAKTEKQLYNDIDSWKQKMRDDKASWSDAWSSIQRKYGLSVDTIDALLGLDYREKYEK